MVPSQAIVIRTASPADERVLARLAALDDQRRLDGPALIAEVDGAPRAALDLAAGRAVADPFHPTADLVDLLRLRAARLEAAEARRTARARRRGLARRPRAAALGA